MRWLPAPTFSSALLPSKVQAGSQPLFLESPSQPNPSLSPAHCPPKPSIGGGGHRCQPPSTCLVSSHLPKPR